MFFIINDYSIGFVVLNDVQASYDKMPRDR
jgi:hypothetical protein